MKQKLFLLAIMVSTALTVSAQKRKIDLWGHVYDHVTHHAISGAKATLMLADSTIVDSVTCGYYTGGYYGTDANYCFSIPRKPQQYIIKVTHPDYDPCFVNYEVKKPGRNTFFDAPWHYMNRKKNTTTDIAATHQLGEVVVKGTRIKMVYKNDTIVYNASAFQLPKGSMLDALIRQMPGVELKDDGTILVNGEKVDFLTLNGKDFFKGKNKVMLENLPMYAVENVKVYRKSTEKSEWLGREVEKKNFVMDVHLKREYNQGYMANAEAASGTKDRYTGRLFGLRFTDASRLSAFVNTNNVNETRRPGQNGEWTPDKALGNGMNKTVNAGFDLNIDDKKKRWDENITANLEYNRKQWNATELRETFASGGSLFSNSHARLDTIARYTDRFVTYNANFVRNTARHGYELRLISSVSSVNHVRERIPIYSTVNPLLITLHNPHLGHSRKHHLLWTLRTTVPERQQNLTLNGRASITLNKMGLRQGYNTTTGAFTQMLDNVSRPSWNLNQEAHFNRPLDAKKRLTLDAHSRISYEENNDFDVVQYSASDGQSAEALLKSAPRSTVHTIYNTENLRFTYRINRFDLSATGDFAYRHSTSDRANFTTLNIFEYNYGFALNCRLPWKLQLAADAKMYSRRGYYSSTMNTDDFVCNASLSRSFLKESLTVRLEAFDIFHQLSSTEYTLNDQGRVESWRKSIPSYLMLHLSWRWSHMPKKKA